MLLIVIAFICGVVAGTVANVPIDRWPRGKAFDGFSRAPCPACGTQRRIAEMLTPAVWLRRRRCLHGRKAGPARESIVAIATGLLAAAISATWGADPRLPAFLVLAWALVVAATIDLEHRIIPNRLTLRLPIVLLFLLVPVAVIQGDWTDLRRGVLAALILPAGMLLLSETYHLIRGRVGIGMGDIKLAISIGLVVGFLGIVELVIFLYTAMLSAVIVTFVLLVVRRLTLASRIPFGPYLAIGALLPLVGGDAVLNWVRVSIGA